VRRLIDSKPAALVVVGFFHSTFVRGGTAKGPEIGQLQRESSVFALDAPAL
jgi:hypothetical protein